RRELETAEPLAGVVGKIELAQLAVVDDVDAELRLAADHVFDGARQALHERCPTSLASGEQLLEIVRPGQCARMGYQNPLGATAHGRLSYIGSRGTSARMC